MRVVRGFKGIGACVLTLGLATASFASAQLADPYAKPAAILPPPVSMSDPMAPVPNALPAYPKLPESNLEQTKLQVPAPKPREYQSSPTRKDAIPRDFGPYAGPFRERLAAKMMEDFGEQYIYATQNAALGKPATDEKRVIFIGDSITDKWDLAKYFPGKAYINRGIGSQVTSQMLVRFHADVVALKPKAVVILAGINDLNGMLQVMTEDQIRANYAAMAELASAHGIKVIFSTILPVNNYTDNARTVLQERHPETITHLNVWLKSYCKRMGFGLIDYTKSLSDANGLMRAEFTSDGVHPNDLAYATMAPIARKVIEATLNPTTVAAAIRDPQTAARASLPTAVVVPASPAN